MVRLFAQRVGNDPGWVGAGFLARARPARRRCKMTGGPPRSVQQECGACPWAHVACSERRGSPERHRGSCFWNWYVTCVPDLGHPVAALFLMEVD